MFRLERNILRQNTSSNAAECIQCGTNGVIRNNTIENSFRMIMPLRRDRQARHTPYHPYHNNLLYGYDVTKDQEVCGKHNLEKHDRIE